VRAATTLMDRAGLTPKFVEPSGQTEGVRTEGVRTTRRGRSKMAQMEPHALLGTSLSCCERSIGRAIAGQKKHRACYLSQSQPTQFRT